MVRIGIIGKTNAGKTTLFNAITMMNAEVSNYPFTTKDPNVGIGYVKTACMCKELGVKDSPQNSICVDGWRFIPVEVVDLPGLIKGASEGLGLGTRFLSVAAQADVILHVVDASGSINAKGEICEPGMGSPLADYYDIEEELVKWYTKNLLENADKVRRALQNKSMKLPLALYDILSGIKVTYPQIVEALSRAKLVEVPFEDWEEDEFRAFATEIRYLSKPTLIVANKMDRPVAEKNLNGLIETFGRSFVIPVSAEVELLLRRAEKAGAISYTPGDEKFVVKDASKLTPRQKWALEYVQSRVFDKWLRTGVDLAITTAVLKLLRINVVYPVEDAKKYSDRKGNVLPDAYLMPQGSTPKDLARQIHSELFDNFLYAIDSVSGIRLPNDYELRDRDVITIVTTKKRKT